MFRSMFYLGEVMYDFVNDGLVTDIGVKCYFLLTSSR